MPGQMKAWYAKAAERRQVGLITFAAVIGLLWTAGASSAQHPASPPLADSTTTDSAAVLDRRLASEPRWTSSIGLWTAGAQNMALRSPRGWPYERDLYLVGLGWRMPFFQRPSWSLAYTINVLPVMVATNMPRIQNVQYVYCVGTQDPFRVVPGANLADCNAPRPIGGSRRAYSERVRGSGVSPLGIEAAFGPPRIQFILGLSGGGAWFSRGLPTAKEPRFNFLADFTSGIQLGVTKHQQIRIAYRFNHISNGGRGDINPGINTSMLQVGWSWRRAAPPRRPVVTAPASTPASAPQDTPDAPAIASCADSLADSLGVSM